MFARIISQVLGEAECGICGVRGKPAASPLPPRPTLLTCYSSPDAFEKSAVPDAFKQSAVCFDDGDCAVSYPTGFSRTPLRSRAYSRDLARPTGDYDGAEDEGTNGLLRDAEDEATYATELVRCRAQLAKDLQKEKHRNRSRNEINAFATGNLLQVQESFSSRSVTTPQGSTPSESSLARALQQQRKGSDASDDSDAEQLDSAGIIDALYDQSAVRAQALHIRRVMLQTSSPCPDMAGMRAAMPRGTCVAERQLLHREQRQEEMRVQAGIDGFQASIREKIERGGVCGSQPLAPFRRAANPAEAVREGVLQYHDKCEDADKDSTFMSRYKMLERYKDGLA